MDVDGERLENQQESAETDQEEMIVSKRVLSAFEREREEAMSSPKLPRKSPELVKALSKQHTDNSTGHLPSRGSCLRPSLAASPPSGLEWVGTCPDHILSGAHCRARCKGGYFGPEPLIKCQQGKFLWYTSSSSKSSSSARQHKQMTRVTPTCQPVTCQLAPLPEGAVWQPGCSVGTAVAWFKECGAECAGLWQPTNQPPGGTPVVKAKCVQPKPGAPGSFVDVSKTLKCKRKECASPTTLPAGMKWAGTCPAKITAMKEPCFAECATAGYRPGRIVITCTAHGIQ